MIIKTLSQRLWRNELVIFLINQFLKIVFLVAKNENCHNKNEPLDEVILKKRNLCIFLLVNKLIFLKKRKLK